MAVAATAGGVVGDLVNDARPIAQIVDANSRSVRGPGALPRMLSGSGAWSMAGKRVRTSKRIVAGNQPSGRSTRSLGSQIDLRTNCGMKGIRTSPCAPLNGENLVAPVANRRPPDRAGRGGRRPQQCRRVHASSVIGGRAGRSGSAPTQVWADQGLDGPPGLSRRPADSRCCLCACFARHGAA